MLNPTNKGVKSSSNIKKHLGKDTNHAEQNYTIKKQKKKKKINQGYLAKAKQQQNKTLQPPT